MSAENPTYDTSEEIETNVPQEQTPSPTPSETVTQPTSTETMMENTPTAETSTAQPTTTADPPRSVSEYYADMARESAERRGEISSLYETQENSRRAAEIQASNLDTVRNEHANSKGFNKIITGIKEMRQESQNDKAQEQYSKDTMAKEKEERTLRENYYGQTGNTEDLLRATDPNRLMEIARANQLNERHGIQTRVSDMTPEQVQERKKYLMEQKELRESGVDTTNTKLPERETYEDKDKRYDQEAVEGLTESMVKILEETNRELSSDQTTKPEYIKTFNITNPEEIKTIAQEVYSKRKAEWQGISKRDLATGSQRLKYEFITKKHSFLERGYGENGVQISRNTWNGEDEAYDQERVNRIEAVEREVAFKLAMLQMTNEIQKSIGGQEVTAEEFVKLLETAKNRDDMYAIYERNYYDEYGTPLNYQRAYKSSIGWHDYNEYGTNLDSRYERVLKGNVTAYTPEIHNTYHSVQRAIIVAKGDRGQARDLGKEDIPMLIANYVNLQSKPEGIRNFTVTDSSLIIPINHALMNEHMKNPGNRPEDAKLLEQANVWIYTTMSKRGDASLRNGYQETNPLLQRRVF